MNKKANIELNQNTYVNVNIQGKQYASTQLDSNYLKCSRELFRIGDIDVSNGISYEEDGRLIQGSTLITEKTTGKTGKTTEYLIVNQNLNNVITMKKLTFSYPGNQNAVFMN